MCWAKQLPAVATRACGPMRNFACTTGSSRCRSTAARPGRQKRWSGRSEYGWVMARASHQGQHAVERRAVADVDRQRGRVVRRERRERAGDELVEVDVAVAVGQLEQQRAAQA